MPRSQAVLGVNRAGATPWLPILGGRLSFMGQQEPALGGSRRRGSRPDDLTPSENECTRSGSEEYVSVKGWRPDDLPDELLGIDEHDCLGRQCFCGSGASCRKVIRQDHGRFGAKWHLERTPKQIYATARE